MVFTLRVPHGCESRVERSNYPVLCIWEPSKKQNHQSSTRQVAGSRQVALE